MEPTPAAPAAPSDVPVPTGASRRWRSLWRLHFYAGIFAMPFILVMALTGLVILYTQPLQDATQGSLRTVEDRGRWLSFDRQEQAVERAFPKASVTGMTMPADDHHATIFALDDGSDGGLEAYVDPYTAKVLGSQVPGDDLVGLSNRLHGTLNNESITVPLPTVSALWDGEAVIRDYVVGDLVLELLGVWTLVLVCSGLYLWWPRRSRNQATPRSGRRFFGLRLAAPGRARWRDLHGFGGMLMFAALVMTLVSGFAWSTYWGANFAALANEISPNAWTDAPASKVGTKADLTRLGTHINWNTGDQPVPASYATEPDGTAPAPISLDDVVTIAKQERMEPGYSVTFPTNSTEAGETTYGSFMLSNSWPRATGEAKDVYLDQFTGTTLATQTGWGYGSVSYAMDVLVETHMGAQLGIFSRIVMTAMCVLAIWSVISAGVMYLKRRRKGTLGLPRRPADVSLTRGMLVLLAVTCVVFPQWGLSALVILALDRFVIRKVPRLRTAFGQR